MPIIQFGQRDLKRGIIVPPAWYRVRIEGVGEEPSKDQKSVNYPVEGTIKFNADNGDTGMADVPLDWNFNSKAIGFAVDFLKAFGVEQDKLVPGQRFDLADAAGKDIDVFVDNEVYNNRTINKVNHKYRKPKS